ncbi:hypothetical protein ABZ438_20070 [Streptomyces sp. NPDC005786]|uniref:hypothetical protein n=1 Tax=unclassified Streptomyces TaxID=2593676 RepID=UPI0033F7FAB7
MILGDARRAGKKPGYLEPRESWYCLMNAYAAWLGSPRWLRLGGGHRAAGNALAARHVLVRMSQGQGNTFTSQPAAPGDPVASTSC